MAFVHEVRTYARARLARIPGLHALARLVLETIRVCLRYRVTGLAAEAGFFALLSLPPLVLGLFGGLGYIGRWLGPHTVQQMTSDLLAYSTSFLTPDVVDRVIAPTVTDVLGQGRADLISVGFLLALWSGSRVLNVILDTISIMYGQSGVRGIVRTRALSFSLYAVGLLVGVVLVPLLLIGPTWLAGILPAQASGLTRLYWPAVLGLAVGSLTMLFHVAVPRRSPWLRDVPGAVLAVTIWAVASSVLRWYLADAVGGTSIYGPLAAPIVLLIWLYFLAIAVLIGAALNAAVMRLWPERGVHGVRASARRAVTAWGTSVATAWRVAPQWLANRDNALVKPLSRPTSRFGDGPSDRLMSVRTRRPEREARTVRM